MRFKDIRVLVVLLLASLAFGGCKMEAVQQSSIKPDAPENAQIEQHKLTIEEIKSKYTEDKIVDIKNVGDHMVLVENIRESYANKFDLYDLVTGDMDTMPTMPEFVKLQSIENDNLLIFLSSGRNSESIYGSFPHVIKCARIKTDINSNDDFAPFYEPTWFDLNTQVSSGCKNCSILADIVPTLDGVQLLFRPIPGREGEFYVAASDIPETTVSFDEGKSQMVLDIKAEKLAKAYEGVCVPGKTDSYVQSIEVSMNETGMKVLLNLKKEAKAYNVSKGYLEPGQLPFIEMSFINEKPLR